MLAFVVVLDGFRDATLALLPASGTVMSRAYEFVGRAGGRRRREWLVAHDCPFVALATARTDDLILA